LYYEDDFKEIDKIIQNRLTRKNDKGIVLLHGLPGTGKTTYLRYLIGRLKKKILFVSPATANEIMNPELMDLLIDNPDSVLIIEDAESIITDRKLSGNSSVSNLLNISDGLLADFLNVQVICTFNSSLTMVDNALMRKGRLIAKYEFGKLNVEKGQRLSDHFGFDTIINKPMTIAEIANQHEKAEAANERIEVIGFRRQEVLMN
jgi:ATP-dependent 26S proteasome regulatory subunit